MHLLPCPQCETPIPVATYQAGGETNCPQCGQAVEIPKLGQLRQLPLTDEEPDSGSSATAGQGEVSLVRRGGFLVFGLIAVGCLLIASFCGIRWFLVEDSGSTEEHLQSVRTEYAKAPAAQLIREFEDMEEKTLELTPPYQYKVIENRRREWGRSASIAGAIGCIALLGAVVTAVAGRPRAGR